MDYTVEYSEFNKEVLMRLSVMKFECNGSHIRVIAPSDFDLKVLNSLGIKSEPYKIHTFEGFKFFSLHLYTNGGSYINSNILATSDILNWYGLRLNCNVSHNTNDFTYTIGCLFRNFTNADILSYTLREITEDSVKVITKEMGRSVND